MSFESQLNRAIAKGFRVRDIPMGYSIVSPFAWLGSDPVSIYARVKDGMIRFEDGGDTLVQLDDFVDTSSDTRLETLRELAITHDVTFDEDAHSFFSDWISINDIDAAVFSFLSFMNRVQDITLLSRKKVEHSFKDDLYEAVAEFFGGGANVVKRAPISPSHAEYIADIMVFAETGKSAAIYAASTELKAVEALLCAELVHRENISNLTPFVVYENFLSSPISRNTRTRTMNNDILRLADWSGSKSELLTKISSSVISS